MRNEITQECSLYPPFDACCVGVSARHHGHAGGQFQGQLNNWPYWFRSWLQLVFAQVHLTVVCLFHRAYCVHRRLVCSLSL